MYSNKGIYCRIAQERLKLLKKRINIFTLRTQLQKASTVELFQIKWYTAIRMCHWVGFRECACVVVQSKVNLMYKTTNE